RRGHQPREPAFTNRHSHNDRRCNQKDTASDNCVEPEKTGRVASFDLNLSHQPPRRPQRRPHRPPPRPHTALPLPRRPRPRQRLRHPLPTLRTRPILRQPFHHIPAPLAQQRVFRLNPCHQGVLPVPTSHFQLPTSQLRDFVTP